MGRSNFVLWRFSIWVILFTILGVYSCTNSPEVKEVNIGYIGPLTTRATDLGIAPSQALILAVEEYNASRLESQPQINLFIKDDQWAMENALPAYKELREKHNIHLVFISNTDGTVAIQDAIEKDNVIAINPLNNDALLSSLNENTFTVAKSTEEANALIGMRMVELGLKKIVILHYPNDFMTRGAYAATEILKQAGVDFEIFVAQKGDTAFVDLFKYIDENKQVDGFAFFGYREFGYAMKKLRDQGIEKPFFGSTTLLDPKYFEYSQGTIVGTECTFFTPGDGNYVLAMEFLRKFEERFNERPYSVWPPMQAYDAMNLTLSYLKHVNERKKQGENFGDWMRVELLKTRFYQGICGNISIKEDGSSRGIYFSLYEYVASGKLQKVKR